MEDLFPQIEELWTNSAGLFAGCSCMPKGPERALADADVESIIGMHPEQISSATFSADALSAAPTRARSAPSTAAALARCSSAPRKAEVKAVRKKQQHLYEKLADVSKEFDLNLQVPSSHSCSCDPLHLPCVLMNLLLVDQVRCATGHIRGRLAPVDALVCSPCEHCMNL